MRLPTRPAGNRQQPASRRLSGAVSAVPRLRLHGQARAARCRGSPAEIELIRLLLPPLHCKGRGLDF
ncbi:MAG: hypothetical protein EB117_16500 [Betaproteobacteria bacterium]|nr:hypothetical protein [Betaproteobacteria bacterium]